MHHCTVYRKDTGEIVQYSNFSCADDIEQISRNFYARMMHFGTEDHDYIEEKSDPQTQYVAVFNDAPTVLAKPDLVVSLDKVAIVADGIDTATLTGLPNPCTIILDDDDPLTETSIIEVEGGGFTFSTEHPGPYSFEVRGRFPFLSWKTVITAS